jgi:hypothetical protein
VHEILDRSPLNNRGWCLQERVISRRIIHFAQDQMYWECQKHCAAEDGTVIEDQNAPKRCLNFGQVSFQEPTFATVMRSWHIIVTEYSMRNLSWPSDKLPAISGLAKPNSQAHRRGVPGRSLASRSPLRPSVAGLAW